MFEGMDTSYGMGGGGFIATQDTAERKSTFRGRNAPWIPVLTKDIHDLLPGQDAVRRGIHESSEVTLVGMIRSEERKLNAASFDYMLDDNSGPPLLVNQLIQDEREGTMVPVAEKTFVRVIGKIRTWGNQKGLTAFTVTPLTNLNEVTMHMLEVTYCRLFYSKDIIRRHEEKSMNKNMPGGAGPMSVNAPIGGATSAYGSSAYGGASKTVAMPSISSGLTGINAEIHRFLASATTESGYGIQEIGRRFPNLGQQKLRDVLEFLASEGHVYTTIDDDHYKTTDG